MSAPARARTRPLAWLRANLFSTPLNTLLTIMVGVVLVIVARPVLGWALGEARWAVVPANFRLLMAGPYPQDQAWRLWAIVLAFSALSGLQWGRAGRMLRGIAALLALVALLALLTQRPWPSSYLLPLAILLLAGAYRAGRRWPLPARSLAIACAVVVALSVVLLGINLGRGGIPTGLWGGLLLTVLLAVSAIVLSFPLGVLLAIGRTSRLPLVSAMSIAFIEIVRGVPLVAVLFMAQLFVPLFLPGVSIDKVVRAVIGMTLFASAYLAENVRGGLQAVGRGQGEAARALGLSGTHTMLFIVLPQALRAVIPAIVGQFIALFKDTSLVAIIGLTDLLGVANSITANPAWLGLYRETYIAIAAIYFVFSYAMSLASRGLERRLASSR